MKLITKTPMVLMYESLIVLTTFAYCIYFYKYINFTNEFKEIIINFLPIYVINILAYVFILYKIVYKPFIEQSIFILIALVLLTYCYDLQNILIIVMLVLNILIFMVYDVLTLKYKKLYTRIKIKKCILLITFLLSSLTIFIFLIAPFLIVLLLILVNLNNAHIFKLCK